MTTAFDPAACGDRFAAFFAAVYDGCGPFPWQQRLAVRVCDPARGWPLAIALPTAAGKTSAIDVAVFAMAYRAEAGHPRTTPRRVFFVVDRRIVVDQAYRHAWDLAKKLRQATGGVLREVAATLRAIGENDRPLDVYALRGGMYREDTWVRSPLQPTVVTSTVDQVGSRLLFRGYGVSESMAPVHAGLVGNDALILLDEAHCSKPFAETAAAVRDYRHWNKELAPFAFVQMTATPAGGVPDGEIERDEADDRAHPFLGKRIAAPKPAKLVVTGEAKKKDWLTPLVKALADEARGLMGRKAEDGADEVRAVGVIVNRVATARAVEEALRGEDADVILLTGRMRPLDRDRLLDRLKPLFTGRPDPLPRPTYVVATQCLEVGADLDFHGLVTECASLDALRQRFGRLNRHAQERVFAPGVVVVRHDQQEPAGEGDEDPVYGNALANTWKWLRGDAARESVDFGVQAMRDATTNLPHEELLKLNSPPASAPVLLPAHLDCWVQTAPKPEPDPDPALFLHGPQSGPPDVQVVFRADLPTEDDAIRTAWRRMNPDTPDPELREMREDVWREAVALCPPSSSEALPVRIGDFKRWIGSASAVPDDLSDVEGAEDRRDDPAPAGGQTVLKWAGPSKKKSWLVTDPDNVQPYATYVVPASAPGLAALGDFPPEGRAADGAPADYGDAAFQRSRDRAVLRLTGTVVGQWPVTVQRAIATALEVGLPVDEGQPPAPGTLHTALAALSTRANDRDDISEELAAVLDAITGGPDWMTLAVKWLGTASRRAVNPHPAGGIVLTGARRIGQFTPAFGDDESSEFPASRKSRRQVTQVTLDEHTGGVIGFAARFAAGCGLTDDDQARFALAARWHDLGKADPRFQAMLRNLSPRSAAGGELLAKSGAAPSTPQQRAEARQVHLYPKGGRHELLSVAFASGRTADDLTLHLIGTHHGGGRPFALAYADDSLARVRDVLPPSVDLLGDRFAWPAPAGDPVTANATGPDRFWRTVRARGWWGAAYLETLFRLADHAASAAEQERESATTEAPPDAPAASPVLARPALRALPLPGLDGSNPLAFLAAVGTLRCLADLAARPDRPDWLAGDVKLSWGHAGSSLGAVLHLPGSPTPDEVAEYLAAELGRDLAGHPAALAVDLAEGKRDGLAGRFADMGRARVPDQRKHSDWVTAHYSELFPKETSQLLIVRRDYLRGNAVAVLGKTTADHLRRTLFARWDYADGLDNQSLHWEPSEDRRHAYQWHQPNGDPTKKKRGGMLGANRLALEAWPLFLSVPVMRSEYIRTRGFKGDKANNTFWTWPVWAGPVGPDGVASFLGLPTLQESEPDAADLRAYGVAAAFRSQRILVGKTPNLTPAAAV